MTTEKCYCGNSLKYLVTCLDTNREWYACQHADTAYDAHNDNYYSANRHKVVTVILNPDFIKEVI